MWKGATLLVMTLLGTNSAELCTNECNGRQEDWCNMRKMIDGDVMQCAEWTSDNVRCVSSCKREGEKYTWCRTGATNEFWGYCAPQGLTSEGKNCVGECIFTKYWWCRTSQDDSSEWGYCSPPNTVKKVEYASNGQECGNECARHGEDYFWCRKPIRYRRKNNHDSDWEYCSPYPNITSDDKDCEDECDTAGETYFWCHTRDGEWGYCSPKAESTVKMKTRDGGTCAGICDRYASDYYYCTTMDHYSGSSHWDYCGRSRSSQITIHLHVVLFLLYNVI